MRHDLSKPSEWTPYVNGEWVSSPDQEVREYKDPYNGTPFGTVRFATPSQVKLALEGAERAQKEWWSMLSTEREAILLKIAEVIESRRPDIDVVLRKEGGGVFGKSMAEVGYMVETFRSAAGQTREMRGETIPSNVPGRVSMTFRYPLGVIVGITPFNAPFLLSGREIGPALAAGNAFVLKPSPWTPIGALLHAEIMEEVGLPKGLFSVIPASDEVYTNALFPDPRVDLVSFTGSAKVGRMLSELAGKYGKRILIEAGGKSPMVVLNDADLDLAVSAAAFGIFFNQGQICMANSRIIVEKGIYDNFCKALVEKVKGIQVGDTNNLRTAVGPLISSTSHQKVQKHIDDAVQKGAEVMVGNTSKGLVCHPTILSGVTKDMMVFDEESFGPLVSVYNAEDYEQALTMANNTNYGLSASIMTKEMTKAMDFAMKCEAGGVHVNDSAFNAEPNAPFGGWKESGAGYTMQNSKYSIQNMTKLKWVTIDLQPRQYPF